jgi:UPF0755 protein
MKISKGVILIIVFSLGLFFLFNRTSKAGEFLIESGQSLKEISQNLRKEGFLRNPLPFYFYVLMKGKEKELKSGIYFFSKKDNFIKMANKIIAGESYKIKVTIPEGLSLKEIDEELFEKGILEKKSLENLRILYFKNDFPFLRDSPADASLEGFLFPDTYFFKPREDPVEVGKIFLKNFDKKITPGLREEIEKKGKKIYEILIMASLLEEELSPKNKKDEENQRIISGILWKRLKNKIPLQVDATITYIKKTTNAEGRASGARISIEDTQIDSPYNTYKYLGLPPGPICNPGIDSILAAISPQESNFWYYLSTPEGETIFNRTLEEHNIAKAKYLR